MFHPCYWHLSVCVITVAMLLCASPCRAQTTQVTPYNIQQAQAYQQLIADTQQALQTKDKPLLEARMQALNDALDNMNTTHLRFDAFVVLAQAHEWLADYEQAMVAIVEAQSLLKQQASPSAQQRQFLSLLMSRTLARLRNFEGAMALLNTTINDAYADNITEHLSDLHLVRGYVNQLMKGPSLEAERDYVAAAKVPEGKVAGRTQMLALNNLGSDALYAGRYAEAKQYFERALSIAARIENVYESRVMEFNLGYLQMKLGAVDEGLLQMQQAYNAFSETAPAEERAEMLRLITEGYEAAGDLPQQLLATQQLLALREQAFKRERESVINELQVRYSAQESELRIALLEQESLLREERFANQQRRERYLAILATILGAVLLLVLFAIRYVAALNKKLKQVNDELEDLSRRDPLTRLFNRRALSNLTGQRGDLLLLLDIDHFKHINDTYGHDIGDKVLVSIGKRLAAALRAQDLALRWGGEEFLVIIRSIEPCDVNTIIEKLRATLHHAPMKGITITVSGGAVLLNDTVRHWQQAIKQADELLYRAKQQGRAQIHAELPDRYQIWQ